MIRRCRAVRDFWGPYRFHGKRGRKSHRSRHIPDIVSYVFLLSESALVLFKIGTAAVPADIAVLKSAIALSTAVRLEISAICAFFHVFLLSLLSARLKSTVDHVHNILDPVDLLLMLELVSAGHKKAGKESCALLAFLPGLLHIPAPQGKGDRIPVDDHANLPVLMEN